MKGAGMRTGNKPSQPKCPLGSIQSNQMDTEAIKAAAWRTQGILVVDVNDKRLDFVDIGFIQRIAGRLYGS